MIECSICQTEHPKNTLFCDECGSFLLEDDRNETDPLSVAEVTWMEREETSESPRVDVTSSLGLKLTIPDSRRNVEVPLAEDVNIGRLDSSIACYPEVDLTGDDGQEKGISRRHAKITRHGGEVFIEDLGSMNGTFLNREKLTPRVPQVLKSGDELQLGELVLRVSFTQ